MLAGGGGGALGSRSAAALSECQGAAVVGGTDSGPVLKSGRAFLPFGLLTRVAYGVAGANPAA
jgi:hypothetical protein